METDKSALVRGLNLVGATSIVVGTIIGTGIFLKARIMTCNVGTPGMVLLVWVVAGFSSLAGALTYAELAAMMPVAGGEYVFMREAYGRPWSFLYGWTQFSISYACSQAAKGVVIAIMLNLLFGGKLEHNYFTYKVFNYPIRIGSMELIAIGSVWIVTAINCLAVAVSGSVISVLTVIKVAIVFFIALAAFLFAHGDWRHFSMSNIGGLCAGVSNSARGGVAGFGAAMLGALWGYDGWSNLTIVAGEVKNPKRNIPIALIGGMLIVMLLYVCANLGYFYVLTPTEVANVSLQSSVATEVIQKFLGPLAAAIMAAALLISSFGSLMTSILVAARIPYAMARDRLIFPRFANVSQKSRVPVFALLIQAIWISVLTLTGSFDALTDSVIFASWIFYAMVTASVFIFRKKMPQAERPYRTWGYPVVPLLFLLIAAGLFVDTIATAPVRSLLGLSLMLLGLPLYWYFNRSTAKTPR